MSVSENRLFESFDSEDDIASQYQSEWGFLAMEPAAYDQPDYAGIISLIKACSNELGKPLPDPVVRRLNLQMRDLRGMLQMCSDNEVKFVVVILPANGRDHYKKVKQMASEVGILTQCIRFQTAQRLMNLTTVRSIVKKVNSKLVDLNQALHNCCLPDCLQELSINTTKEKVIISC